MVWRVVRGGRWVLDNIVIVGTQKLEFDLSKNALTSAKSLLHPWQPPSLRYCHHTNYCAPVGGRRINPHEVANAGVVGALIRSLNLQIPCCRHLPFPPSCPLPLY